MSAMQNKLIADFADAEYAHAYMGSHTVSKIAAQIFWTRTKRNWKQTELARRAGMAQERISKIESGDFTSLTMKTLHKLAEALDVNLRVEFEPFSHGIMSVCSQSRATLELPDRATSLRELQHSFAVMPMPFGLPPVVVPSVMAMTHSPVLTTGPGAATAATTGAPLVTQWPGQCAIAP